MVIMLRINLGLLRLLRGRMRNEIRCFSTSTSTSTSIHDTQMNAWKGRLPSLLHPLLSSASFLDFLLMENTYFISAYEGITRQLIGIFKGRAYRESQASTSPCTCRKTRLWDLNRWVCQWFRTSRIGKRLRLAPKQSNFSFISE